MVEAQVRTTDWETAFQSRLAALSGQRKAALEAFLAVGWPTSKDEEFRFTPLRALQEMQISDSSSIELSPTDFSTFLVPEFECYRYVFVNGRFSGHLSSTNESPSVQFAILDPESQLDSIATYFGKLGTTNDDRFVHLNRACCHEIANLKIDAKCELEKPIHFIFLSTSNEPTDSHIRLQIELGEAARATLVETYVSDETKHFTNAISEVTLGRNASLKHVRYQRESRESYHIGQVWAHQEHESNYTSFNVQFGAAVGRVDINVWINGEYTETRLDGTYVANGTQLHDNKTRIDHAKPNCHSFEVYKGILDDESHGIFNGKIFVYEDAQKTDAKQTNQALLLSPKATINTKPQLEIFADDVKCTHGATIGQMRDDQLFYLQSRGIPATEAKGLLVYAFAAEVLEKIEIDDLRTYLEKELFAKLAE
jgi:Fe-S cluster assembly protein SufD